MADLAQVREKRGGESIQHNTSQAEEQSTFPATPPKYIVTYVSWGVYIVLSVIFFKVVYYAYYDLHGIKYF